MIKTLKQTIKNLYYWIKQKLIRFKNWIILIIFGAVVIAAPPILLPNIPDIALENIQAKYEASNIQNKYRLEKTAFILDAIDENAIQAEVGNKNSDSFEPSLTLRKWDNETNFKVKYKHSEKEKDQKVDIEDKKIKWKGEKTEVHYYDIKKGELLHDKVLEHDVFEVEVLLLEKPDTNIVGFDIETKGLVFNYQPELTQEEIDEGAFRPENVIGSYAVYHESKQGDYSKMGLKNYRAGKAFHIYRPKIIDSAGTEVWGELNITDNLLTVAIPQEFLDNAVYPVRHAAGLTFGYTTGGSSNFFEGTGYLTTAGITYAPGQDGVGVSMSIYGIASAHQFRLVIYDNTSLVRGTAATNFVSGPNWATANLTSSVDVFNATNYYLVYTINDSSTLYYDTAGAVYGKYTSFTFSNSFPATVSWSTSGSRNWKYSIYCTYTAEEAEARRMFLTQ